MSVEFDCHQCGSELRIRETDAGKRIRCPHCGMINDRPGGSQEPLTADGPDVTRWHQESPIAHQQPTAQWSLQTPDGQVYGPVPRWELDNWEREGRVSAQCLVRPGGRNPWQSATALYPHLAGATETEVASPPRDPRAHVGTTRRQADPDNRRSNNGGAVLGMGILGIILLSLPVFAMIAWAMGSSESRAMSRGEADTRGRWMVDVGYFLGVVGTFLGIAVWLGCCVIFRVLPG